jgi:hypothetical protein
MPLGIQAKAMLFPCTIFKWQTNNAEGWGRVLDTTNGTSYILNTNRLDGILNKNRPPLTRTSFYYFDNPTDNRDNSSYVVCNSTVAEIITYMDTVPSHTHVDLKMFPNGDHTQAAVTTVIPIDNFAFARAVDDAHAATQSYVWYVDSGWRFKRCRVEHSLAQILALIV